VSVAVASEGVFGFVHYLNLNPVCHIQHRNGFNSIAQVPGDAGDHERDEDEASVCRLDRPVSAEEDIRCLVSVACTSLLLLITLELSYCASLRYGAKASAEDVSLRALIMHRTHCRNLSTRAAAAIMAPLALTNKLTNHLSVLQKDIALMSCRFVLSRTSRRRSDVSTIASNG
jgi:hypothetical protein